MRPSKKMTNRPHEVLDIKQKCGKAKSEKSQFSSRVKMNPIGIVQTASAEKRQLQVVISDCGTPSKSCKVTGCTFCFY